MRSRYNFRNIPRESLRNPKPEGEGMAIPERKEREPA